MEVGQFYYGVFGVVLSDDNTDCTFIIIQLRLRLIGQYSCSIGINHCNLYFVLGLKYKYNWYKLQELSVLFRILPCEILTPLRQDEMVFATENAAASSRPGYTQVENKRLVKLLPGSFFGWGMDIFFFTVRCP